MPPTKKMKIILWSIIFALVLIIFAIVYFSTPPNGVDAMEGTSIKPDKIVIFMSSIVSSLLIIVGVFISKYFKVQTEAIDELKTAIKELSEGSCLSNKLLFAYAERMDMTDKMNADHWNGFEKRFEEHKEACKRGFKSKE